MPRVRVYGALVLVQLLFGVHYFVAKLALEMMPPRAWAALRILGGATLLILYNVFFLRQPAPNRADLGRLAFFAFLGVACNQLLFVEGLARTTPAHSALINSIIPVATLGMAILLGKEQRTARRVAAICVAFASVLVLLRIESFRFEDTWVLGDLLTLANACSFSLFLVLSRDTLRRMHPLAATAWLLGLGALGVVAVGGGPLLGTDFGALPARFWWFAVYTIAGATALAYFLNSFALRHVDSSMVALFIYLQVPLATALSYFYLDDKPTPRFLLATAGIFFGVFLAVSNGAESRGPELEPAAKSVRAEEKA